MRKALFLNRHCTLLPSNMAAGQTEISGKYPKYIPRAILAYYTNFDLKYTDSTTLRTDRISINKNQSRDQLKTSYRHTNTFHHNKQASINIPHIFLQRLLIFVD